MNKFRKYLPQIIATCCAVLVAIATVKSLAFKKEIENLQKELKAQSAQITKMQNEFGSEVSARTTCEAAAQPLKDDLAALNNKLESFALQAASCEQLRKKLKK